MHFVALTDAEIAYYVDEYKPFDKAGAYGIQEWIGFVAVTRVYEELKKIGAIWIRGEQLIEVILFIITAITWDWVEAY